MFLSKRTCCCKFVAYKRNLLEIESVQSNVAKFCCEHHKIPSNPIVVEVKISDVSKPAQIRGCPPFLCICFVPPTSPHLSQIGLE